MNFQSNLAISWVDITHENIKEQKANHTNWNKQLTMVTGVHNVTGSCTCPGDTRYTGKSQFLPHNFAVKPQTALK